MCSGIIAGSSSRPSIKLKPTLFGCHFFKLKGSFSPDCLAAWAIWNAISLANLVASGAHFSERGRIMPLRPPIFG